MLVILLTDGIYTGFSSSPVFASISLVLSSWNAYSPAGVRTVEDVILAI